MVYPACARLNAYTLCHTNLKVFFKTHPPCFQYYSGSKSLNPVRRPPLCPSMHRSQWSIGQNVQDTTFDTEYAKTYFEKDIIPVSI